MTHSHRMRFRGIPPYSPADEGDLIGLYDASVITSLWTNSGMSTQVAATSDPVGRVYDLSGNGNHLDAVNDAARYTYDTDGIDTGIAGIISNGTTSILSSPGLDFSVATIIARGKCITSPASSGIFKVAPTSTDIGTNGFVHYRGSPPISLIGNPTPTWYKINNAEAILAGETFTNTFYWADTFASMGYRKNSVIQTLSDGPSAGYAAPSGSLPFHLGAAYGSVRGSYVFRRVAIFSKVLTTEQALRVEEWAAE